MTKPVVYRCTHADCNLPFLKLQDGRVIVVSRHRGEKHYNSVSLLDLLADSCEPGALEKLLPLIYEMRGNEGE